MGLEAINPRLKEMVERSRGTAGGDFRVNYRIRSPVFPGYAREHAA
jgi:hypothetical protein